MTPSYDAVVLSPHLDDAVLSCGGQIHARARRGERVLVVTPFTGDEPRDPPSDLVRDLHRWSGLRTEVVATRRREDERACHRLGAEALHLALPDAAYRRRPGSSEVVYRSLAALFGEVDPAETEIAAELAEALAGLPAARQVLSPLTVGGHVDHRLVRRAAESIFPDVLAFYEDFPYVLTAGALERVLPADQPRWRSEVIPLSPADLEAKVRAIADYRSQIRPLFGNRWKMRLRVRRYARRVGGERVWRSSAG